MIRQYFQRSEKAGMLFFHLGNAAQIIPKLTGPFDLVFIDADKEQYAHYFDLVIEKMSPGGLLIADNVLWSGKVLDSEAISTDPETRSLKYFTEKVHADPRVENLLLPVRDGLMLLRKK
jgi:caffeoyl-CoA O-methyltransferase